VALTRSNVNPALVFEYLFQKIRILKAYLGEDFDENSMRNNMTLIYELMDETMDFGYPQNCAVDVLRLYINLGTVRPQVSVVFTSCVRLDVGPMVHKHTMC
jgi:AP-2 complex subunit mu-1